MTGAAAAVLRCPRMLVTNDTHTYLGPQSAALGSGLSAIGLGLDELAERQSLRVHVYIPRINDANTHTGLHRLVAAAVTPCTAYVHNKGIYLL